MASSSGHRGVKRASDVHEYEWEADSDSDQDDSEGEGEPDPGEMFAALLQDLFMKSAISARSVCLLCYWATLGGLKGPATKWGLGP